MKNNQTERIAYLKKTIKELEQTLDLQRRQAYSPSIDFDAQNKAQFEMIETYELLDHAKTRLIKILTKSII
jgi:hypothetical protein